MRLPIFATAASYAALSVYAFAQVTQTYTYDELGRLIEVKHDGADGPKTQYNYDAAGNRDSVIITGVIPPPTPVISIQSAAVNKMEGESGGATFTFTVDRTNPNSGASTIQYAVTGSGAFQAQPQDFAGGDYPAGAIEFESGEPSEVITFSVVDDAVPEENETFTVTLSSPDGADLGVPSSTQGTIIDDDETSGFQEIDAGASSISLAPFFPGAGASVRTVSPFEPLASAAQMNLPYSNNGAMTGAGYFLSEEGVVNGAQFNQILDGDINNALQFGNLLTNASTIVGTSFIDTFSGRDRAEIIYGGGGNDSVNGGGGDDTLYGENGADFLRGGGGDDHLYGGPGDDIFYGDGGSDTVHFVAAGQYAPTINDTLRRVEVNGPEGALDRIYYDDIEFIQFGNDAPIPLMTWANGGGGSPDPDVSITATNAIRNEGNSGSTPFTFTVTRSGDLSSGSTVNWSVSSASEANGADFIGGALPQGTVTFNANQSNEPVIVNVSGDTGFEPNEDFTVTLDSPIGANIVANQSSATGTINNDDASGGGSIVNATYQAEGASLQGPNVQSIYSGGEGGAYVDYVTLSNEHINWVIDGGASGGTADLSIRYALGSSASRAMTLEVNGTVVTTSATFTTTSAWDSWDVLEFTDIPLNAGNNDVRLIATGQSGPNVDSLTVSDAGGGGGGGGTPTAVTLQAENLSLTNFLTESYAFAFEGSVIATPWTSETCTAVDSNLSASVTPGAYDVEITYYDESDGVSTITFDVSGGGQSFNDSWVLNEATGNPGVGLDNQRTQTFSNVQVTASSVLTLTSQIEGGERSRIDQIKFTPIQ